MFSDAERLPDWRDVLSAQPRHVGLVLRDYDAPHRADLAADMAHLCRREGRRFAIAGDRNLARQHGALFHCPSYLIARAAARGGGVSKGDMAATHNAQEIMAAHRAGFGAVFISPVFATNSHPKARPLGLLRAQKLLYLAQTLGLKAYALGGMNMARHRRLRTADGWAAIDGFTAGRG